MTVSFKGETIAITVSIGVAASRPDDSRTSGSELLNRADQALYASKKAGRNRTTVSAETAATNA